ncbi:hypothetical protein SeMB42_g06315 [Synchytrium endobioticum]|uniref:Uncharacterized protein n=1 Tax=Synchytrium endobioticum TaxID=286115 RepID=A0A507CIS7_9FUNG|nr:hypothetical protein SeMB42_g06315 [Synchytrium endobioticum]
MAYSKVAGDEEKGNGIAINPTTISDGHNDNNPNHERPPLVPPLQPLQFDAPDQLIFGYPVAIVRTSGFMALNVASSIASTRDFLCSHINRV